MFAFREQPEVEEWARDSEHVADYETARGITPERVTLADGSQLHAATYPQLTLPSEKFNFVFDQDDNRVISVAPGEIAVSINVAEKNSLQKGDALRVALGGTEKTLAISHILKDYAFGPETMGIRRAIVSQSDYDAFAAEPGGVESIMWCLSTGDMDAFVNDRNHQSFMVSSEFQSGILVASYHMEQISSVVMLVVSMILVLIAMSLLRLTIRITIEEDFREIGVLKAIGIKNAAIRRLYIVKYFAIAAVGSAFGAVCAAPFAQLLIAGLAKRIVLTGGDKVYAICAACAACVVGLVLLFSWLATRRVRKTTAIQAIREGATGERFKRKGILRLSGGRAKPVTLFLACNDILSGLRSFVIIFLALVVSLQMILVPSNMLSTLKDGETLGYFMIEKADCYSGDVMGDLSIMGKDIVDNPDFGDLVNLIKQMEREYAEKGVDVGINTGLMFMAQAYVSDPYDKIAVSAFKQTNGRVFGAQSLTGTLPLLSNEIAMTYIIMERLGIALGDSVYLAFGEDNREYIVTAGFECMMSLGEYVVLAPEAYPDMLYCVGLTALQFTFRGRDDIPAQIAALKADMPEVEYLSAEELVKSFLLDTIQGMEQLIRTLTLIALCIIALVTFLICQTLLARDKSAIALLRSIGFAKRTIRAWQIARIVIVALLADVAGVALSFAVNPFVTRNTFGMMGAPSVPTRIVAADVFGLYPALFLALTAAIAAIAAHSANRVDMKTVGNLE
jgi:putative ABC transport system permease protein